jgi:flagellar motor switch protein FliG
MNEEGKRKSAILLMILGEETASSILRYLSEEERNAIVKEIAENDVVSSEESSKVLDEAYTNLLKSTIIATGGVEYARKVLEKAEGIVGATKFLARMNLEKEPGPFEFLKKFQPEEIYDLLLGETPQTIAFVLTYLDYSTAAQVIEILPENLRNEVIWRMSQIEEIPPGIEKIVKDILEKKSTIVKKSVEKSKEIKRIAEILNRLPKSVKDGIFEYIEGKNEEIAQKIKDSLFEFEDLKKLDNRTLQTILRGIELKELAIALKLASPELKETIFNNLSENARQMLKEEIEYLGPMRISEVEAVQRKIIMDIQKMEQEGKITIITGGEEVV